MTELNNMRNFLSSSDSFQSLPEQKRLCTVFRADSIPAGAKDLRESINQSLDGSVSLFLLAALDTIEILRPQDCFDADTALEKADFDRLKNILFGFVMNEVGGLPVDNKVKLTARWYTVFHAAGIETDKIPDPSLQVSSLIEALRSALLKEPIKPSEPPPSENPSSASRSEEGHMSILSGFSSFLRGVLKGNGTVSRASFLSVLRHSFRQAAEDDHPPTIVEDPLYDFAARISHIGEAAAISLRRNVSDFEATLIPS